MSADVSLRGEVLRFARQRWHTQPEYFWRTAPRYAVLRHSGSRKWYGLLMDVPRERLGLAGGGVVDILDVKCDPILSGSLRKSPGFLPAYHMHHDGWLTILLDGTVELEMVCSLLCASYELTADRAKAPKAAVPSGPRSWIVPANYHYFDLEAAFAASDLLNWKQTSSVAAGDIVYLYVGAPVSAVRYRCQVLEVGIPYDYDDGKVRMRRVMKLKRLFTYPPDAFPLSRLRSYGVQGVRSARGLPPTLARALEAEAKTNA